MQRLAQAFPGSPIVPVTRGQLAASAGEYDSAQSQFQ